MNPDQNVPLDVVIKRLEEANAQAYERAARARERTSESAQDAARHRSDQENSPAVPDRRSSRGWALGIIGWLFAATIGVVAFVWQSSYFDGAKLIVARWALPLVQTTPQSVAPIAAPTSAELAQSLQTIGRDLGNLAQELGQLKTSEEQMARDNAAVGEMFKGVLSQITRDNAAVGALKAALSQLVRDNAAIAEQLKTALSQLDRDNAAVIEQLKAAQELTARPIAPRLRRKAVPTLPQDGEPLTLGR
jgi:septal ring factor EnvC (AmiA/AmiB activator)